MSSTSPLLNSRADAAGTALWVKKRAPGRGAGARSKPRRAAKVRAGWRAAATGAPTTARERPPNAAMAEGAIGPVPRGEGVALVEKLLRGSARALAGKREAVAGAEKVRDGGRKVSAAMAVVTDDASAILPPIERRTAVLRGGARRAAAEPSSLAATAAAAAADKPPAVLLLVRIAFVIEYMGVAVFVHPSAAPSLFAAAAAVAGGRPPPATATVVTLLETPAAPYAG
mmetsp:Transcript_17599/g.44669  ORF Transcript_17599/g.44669 Transcript_17599/m.44669 type:complete len:228 (-) Transcript_17599:367-1050(-)